MAPWQESVVRPESSRVFNFIFIIMRCTTLVSAEVLLVRLFHAMQYIDRCCRDVTWHAGHSSTSADRRTAASVNLIKTPIKKIERFARFSLGSSPPFCFAHNGFRFSLRFAWKDIGHSSSVVHRSTSRCTGQVIMTSQCVASDDVIWLTRHIWCPIFLLTQCVWQWYQNIREDEAKNPTVRRRIDNREKVYSRIGGASIDPRSVELNGYRIFTLIDQRTFDRQTTRIRMINWFSKSTPVFPCYGTRSIQAGPAY